MRHQLDELPALVPPTGVLSGDAGPAVKMLLLEVEYAHVELALQGYRRQPRAALRDLSPLGGGLPEGQRRPPGTASGWC